VARPSLLETVRSPHFKKLAPDQQRELVLGAYPEAEAIADEGWGEWAGRKIEGSRGVPDDTLQRWIAAESGVEPREGPSNLERAGALAADVANLPGAIAGIRQQSGQAPREPAQMRQPAPPAEPAFETEPLRHEGGQRAGQGGAFRAGAARGWATGFPGRHGELSAERPAGVVDPNRPITPPGMRARVPTTKRASAALRQRLVEMPAHLASGLLRSFVGLSGMRSGGEAGTQPDPERDQGLRDLADRIDEWAHEHGQMARGAQGPVPLPENLSESLVEAVGALPPDLLAAGLFGTGGKRALGSKWGAIAGEAVGFGALTALEASKLAEEDPEAYLEQIGWGAGIGALFPPARRMGRIARMPMIGGVAYKGAPEEAPEHERISSGLVMGALAGLGGMEGAGKRRVEMRRVERALRDLEKRASQPDRPGVGPLTRVGDAMLRPSYRRPTLTEDVAVRTLDPQLPPELFGAPERGAPPMEPAPYGPRRMGEMPEGALEDAFVGGVARRAADMAPALPERAGVPAPRPPDAGARTTTPSGRDAGRASAEALVDRGEILAHPRALGGPQQWAATMGHELGHFLPSRAVMDRLDKLPENHPLRAAWAETGSAGARDTYEGAAELFSAWLTDARLTRFDPREGRDVPVELPKWLEGEFEKARARMEAEAPELLFSAEAARQRPAVEHAGSLIGPEPRGGARVRFPDGGEVRVESEQIGREMAESWAERQGAARAAAQREAERAVDLDVEPEPAGRNPTPHPTEPAPPPRPAGPAPEVRPGEPLPRELPREQLEAALPAALGRELNTAEREILSLHVRDLPVRSVVEGQYGVDATTVGRDFWLAIADARDHFKGETLRIAQERLRESTNGTTDQALPVPEGKPTRPRKVDPKKILSDATSKEESRYGLQHIAVESDGTAVASDGHRLYWWRGDHGLEQGYYRPAERGKGFVRSTAEEANHPEYWRNVADPDAPLPRNQGTIWDVPLEAVAQAAADLRSARTRYGLKAGDPGQADIPGGVRVNARYLEDALAAVRNFVSRPDAKVTLEVAGGEKPFSIRVDYKGGSFEATVMPMLADASRGRGFLGVDWSRYGLAEKAAAEAKPKGRKKAGRKKAGRKKKGAEPKEMRDVAAEEPRTGTLPGEQQNLIPGIEGPRELQPGANHVPMIVPGITDPAAPAPMRIKQASKILGELARGLGITIGEDTLNIRRMRRRGVLGTYYPNQPATPDHAFLLAHWPRGSLNISRYGDLQNAAHEVMHAMVDKYPRLRRLFEEHETDVDLTARQLAEIGEVRRQTNAVSYDVTIPEEGLTELFRLWLTQDTQGHRAAPDAMRVMERELRQTLPKKEMKALEQAKRDMHEHLEAGLVDLYTSDTSPVADNPAWSPYWTRGDTLREQGVDHYHAILHMERVLAGHPTKDGAYEAFRRLSGQGDMIEGMTKWGPPVYDRRTGEFSWSGKEWGLERILEPVAWSEREMDEAFTLFRMLQARELFPQRVIGGGKVVEPRDFVDVAEIPTKELHAAYRQARRYAKAAEANHKRAKKEGKRPEEEIEALGRIAEELGARAEEAQGRLRQGRLRDEYERAGPTATREKKYEPEQFNAIIERLSTPKRLEVAERLKEFQKKWLDFAIAADILAPEQIANFKRREYIFGLFKQFQPRVGADHAARHLSGGRGGQPTYTLKGSPRPEMDGLEALVYGPSRILQLGLENIAKQKLAETFSKPGGGMFAQPVKPSANVVKAKVAAFRDALFQRLRKMGLDDETIKERFGELIDLPGEVEALSWLSGEKRPWGDEIMTVLYRGKPRYWEVTEPHVLGAIGAMRSPTSLENGFFRFMDSWRRFYQGTIVLDPEFMVLSNLLRDTIYSSIGSRTGSSLTMPFHNIRSVVSSMRNSPEYRDFLANGGGVSTRYHDAFSHKQAIHRFAARRNIKNVVTSPRELTHFLSDVLGVVSFKGGTVSWGEALTMGRAFGRHFEVASKLSEYRRAVAGGETKTHAAYLGREVNTDFAVHGANPTLAQLVRSMPFANAMIAGNDNFYRKFWRPAVTRGKSGRWDHGRKQHLLTAQRVATYAGMMSAIELSQMGQDWWESRTEWETLAYNTIDTGFVDGDGEKVILRLPKPFEVGLIENIVTSSVRAAAQGSREAREWAQAVVAALWLNYGISAPPGPNIVLEQVMNRNTFTWGPIVPPDLERLQPYAQYRPDTPRFFKQWGEQFERLGLGDMVMASPVRIEQAWRGLMGALGSYVVMASEGMNDEGVALAWDEIPMVRRLLRSADKYDRSYGQFFEYLGQMNTSYNTFMAEMERGNFENMVERLEESDPGMRGRFRGANRARQGLEAEVDRVERGEYDEALRRQYPGDMSMRERRRRERAKLRRQIHEMIRRPVEEKEMRDHALQGSP